MKKPAVVVVVLAAMMFAIQASAQTVRCPATRINCSASYARSSVIVHASSIAGRDTVPVTFSEKGYDYIFFFARYRSNTITIAPASRLSGDMIAQLSVLKLPPGGGTGAPSGQCPVHLDIRVGIKDAATDSTLVSLVPFPSMQCWATHPLDTTMTGNWRVDMSRYIGRKVYLSISISANPEMLEARDVATFDAVCSEDRRSNTNSLYLTGSQQWH